MASKELKVLILGGGREFIPEARESKAHHGRKLWPGSRSRLEEGMNLRSLSILYRSGGSRDYYSSG